MAVVELVRLAKAYGGSAAVKGVSLKIDSGEFFSLLGPSGCGKTTTLRMIAGFVVPDEGRILIDNVDITDQPPEKRGIGIVFQNYAIFPHMNVYDNIAFGLRLRKLGKIEIGRRVKDALQQVGLVNLERRFQKELSGGEQQRVALARVLVTQPRVLLLDEPMSALDKNLREEMKLWIKELQRNLGITTIYVTHDQGEALAMSDRIGVMAKGLVVQVGTPADIYETPANLFVTRFIGESNLLDGTIQACNGGSVELALGEGIRVQAPQRPGLGIGQRVKLVIRPENVFLGQSEETGRPRLPALISDTTYQGAFIRYRLTFAGQTLVAEVQNRVGQPHYKPGSGVVVHWDQEGTEILPVE